MGIAVMLKKLLLGRAFSAEEGRVTILGRYNVTLVESCGFAYLHQKIFEELGEKKAFKILMEATEIAIENATKAFGLVPFFMSIEKLLPLTDFYGLGKFSVIHKEENEKKVVLLIKVENSPLTEYAKQKWGKNSKICKIVEANLIVTAKLIYKKTPKVEEISCYTKGAPYCTFRVEIEK
ncbi:MAG: hypothetical protein QXQ69_00580 [Candidatus Aenigmatarchaeota archaeon]